VEQEIKQVNHLLELKNIYNHEKQILAVLLFISSFGFQSVNDYKAVIPIKYDSPKTDSSSSSTISKV
jgi:hypothetical protein